MMAKHRYLSVLLPLLLLVLGNRIYGQQWQVGLAKMDITPQEPLRLSGYASRDLPASGAADLLHVRVLVISSLEPSVDDTADQSVRQARPPSTSLPISAQSTQPLVLVSLEAIAVPAGMTNELAAWLQAERQIPRANLVISCTHSHCAPQLPGSVENLFSTPLSDEQQAASQRYQQQVIQAIRHAITQALDGQRGAKLELADGQADFAVNRRVIEQGRWINFGIQQDGPVDHRVRVLKISDLNGELLGAVFQYACHATTMGPEFNQISGDWPGLAAGLLESSHAGALFLPIIGCGADINPHPRGEYRFAQQHARAIQSAVQNALTSRNLQPLPQLQKSQFGIAGLEPELPTTESLQQQLQQGSLQQRKRATKLLEILKTRGRLPESIPMPIHVWQFGDLLSWVFLGGEPVVDYQVQLEKELPTESTWVAGYCDDLFAYVASQQQYGQGGYEVDESMIYFMQPGRWKSGTQSEVVARALQISRQQRGDDEPLGAAAGVASMQVTDGYRLELVASEPMIRDPVNIAFGLDGSVWIVEMNDYPLGVAGGGQIKRLRDTDGDGRLDSASLFLNGLSFPTSVHPWRNGIIVIAAPEVFYSEDTDGDGIADERRTLLSGLAQANPQHRATGFELGLDGRLHLGLGHGNSQIFSHLNQTSYEVRHQDLAWNPDNGQIELFVQGETQFVPGRDCFGNWFGSNNYQPIYQYVFQTSELSGQTVDTGVIHHLLTPGDAPPVFPRSQTSDRFNDMYSKQRFTSACSAVIVRNPGLFPQNYSFNSQQPVALICEPVHNLVARIQLQPEGSVFTAERHADDAQFDFLTSSDPWSRPVRVINAPDGSIWVLDMYRRVIEHPEWIPVVWQERIDLRCGATEGRIYRIYHQEYQPTTLQDWRRADPLLMIQSDIGALRDLAAQGIFTDQFVSHTADSLRAGLEKLLDQSPSSPVVANVLGVLSGKGWLQSQHLATVIRSSYDVQLVCWALKLAARMDRPEPVLLQAIDELPARNLGSQIDLQWLLTVKNWPDYSMQSGLASILTRGQPDRWFSAALNLCNSESTAELVLRSLLNAADQHADNAAWLQEQLATVRRQIQLLPAKLREQWVVQLLNKRPLERQPKDSRLQTADDLTTWLASDTLLLVAVSSSISSEAVRSQHAAAIEEALAVLLQLKSSGDESSEKQDASLTLLIGNQVLPVERELFALQTMIERGGSLASWAIQRARFLSHDQVAKLLIQSWNRLTTVDQARAANLLVARTAWRSALLDALESGSIASSEIPASNVQTMISMGDLNLRNRAAAIFGKPSPRQSIVNEYLAAMPNPSSAGDPIHGQKIFKEHCAVCHTAQNSRPAVGPTIENLNHWSNDQWVTSILAPNQAVEEKYRQTTVLTKDQEIVAGIVIQSSDTSIRLASSDATVREIELAEIEELKPTNISLMPEGFESKLTFQQLADLIRFLRSPSP